MRVFFALVFYFSCFGFYSQVNFNWAKQLAGNNTTSRGNATTLDAAGNVYTTGTFSGSVDFDPGPGNFTLSGSGVYISKLDGNGNFLWAKNAGDGDANVNSIKIDGSGNIYLAGNFRGTVDFDPGITSFNLTGPTTTTTGYEMFISKLDATGNFSWAKQIARAPSTQPGNYVTTLSAMTLDLSGNVLFTGVFDGSFDFDPGLAVYTLTTMVTSTVVGSFNTDNVFVCKLDPLGNFVWAKQLTGPSNNNGSYAIAIDSFNNVYFTGHLQGTIDVDPGPATFTVFVGGQFLEKIDASGNFVWFNSTPSGWGGHAIAIDGSNNVYWAGDLFGTFDFDPGPGVFNLTSAGMNDIVVCKVSGTGSFIWAQKVGSPSNELATSIALDLLGNTYVTGIISPFTFGDALIAKIDGTGNFIWAKQIGGVNSDGVNGIAIDAANNIYATGYFNSNVDFDPTNGINILPGNTNSLTTDAFVLKWSPCTPTLAPPANTSSIANQNICANLSTTLSVSGPPTISWFNFPNSPTPIASGSSFVTPLLSAGVYTYYAESNACSIGRTPVTITVNPTPTISANGGSVCIGSSFTINPGGVNTYTVSGGSAVVSPTTNSSYTITGTDANGCVATNPAIINITVNALPTVSATTSNSIICPGQQATLTASGATVFMWSTNSSGTAIVVSPTINTTYTVNGTDANGCGNFATITQSVNLCTDLQALKNTEAAELIIYPNPNNGIFTLQVNSVDESSDLEIYNSMGQIIFTKKITIQKVTVDLSGYPNGLYYLKIKDVRGGQFKFIKN